jgi:hypothetical protein
MEDGRMTAGAWEFDGQKTGGESGVSMGEKFNGLKDGYREMSRMNLFLAKEAVFSDEEAFCLLLKREWRNENG